MEFLPALLLVSASLLLPSLGLAVSGQEAHEPSPAAGVHVPVAPADLPAVAASVLGAESWLRAHVLARYPSERITAVAVGDAAACHDEVRLSRAAKNLRHSLLRWGLADDIAVAAPAACAADGQMKRRLYGRHHLPPPQQPPSSPVYAPPPPGVPLSFAPHFPPEVIPSVPPSALVPASSPVSLPGSPPPAMPAGAPPTMPSTPPMPAPASSPPDAAAGGMAPSAMPPPCQLAPPPAAPGTATSPPPWSGGQGWNGGAGLWCVAKPTVPEDRLQEAMDYACGQDGIDCQAVAPGGSCFYPDSIASHASYAFNSYWQKMRRVGGSCSFGGAAVLINSDPSYLQCRFMLG